MGISHTRIRSYEDEQRKRKKYSHDRPSPFGLYDAISPRTIHGTLLKFAKGDWVAGEDGRAVPKGTEFAVYMSEILAGWVRWEDNKPTEHQMGRIVDGYAPPRRDDLGSIDRAAWETDADGRLATPGSSRTTSP